MRKIEIIIPTEHLEPVIELLDQNDVEGYSMLEVNDGKGLKQGRMMGVNLSGSRRTLVIVICPDDRAQSIAPSLADVVSRHEGIAWSSAVERMVPAR